MLNEEEFCIRIGIEHRTLRLWIDEGWIAPHQEERGLLLTEVDLARARLIRDLRDGIGVNEEGIGIILDLIDQVHGLRSIVQGLIGSSRSAGPSTGA